MSNTFATPAWQSDSIGDSTCKQLFENNGLSQRKKKSFKAKSNKIAKNKKLKANLSQKNNKFTAKNNAIQELKTLEQTDSIANRKNANLAKELIKKSKSKRRKSNHIVDTVIEKKINQTTNNPNISDAQEPLTEEIDEFIQLPKINRTNSSPKNSLREKMLNQLRGSHFRYLNEQLYLSTGQQAVELFKKNPDDYQAYHDGFRQQVDIWPLNPVDVIIKAIKKMSKDYVIADFGCGDAKLASAVKQQVHSFDLVALNPSVIACDMAHVPLKSSTIDVVVFCLSLMGTNLQDYLKEANRVLKIGGILKIAEVESRFDNVGKFVDTLKCFNFKNIRKDLSHNLFVFADFKKEANVKKKIQAISLNPCLYKKR